MSMASVNYAAHSRPEKTRCQWGPIAIATRIISRRNPPARRRNGSPVADFAIPTRNKRRSAGKRTRSDLSQTSRSQGV